MVNALIDRGARSEHKPEDRNGAPLMVVSGRGRVELMRILLAAGIEVLIPEEGTYLGFAQGFTALIGANLKGQVEAIHAFLVAGSQNRPS